MQRILALTVVLAASLPAWAVPPRQLSVTVERSDHRVGTYISSPWGFSTRSYWIEGPTGLALIDAQFLPSAVTEAVAVAEQLTGKKVELCVVLHAK